MRIVLWLFNANMVKCEQDVVLVVQVRGEEDLGLMEGDRVMD